jgi:hypothetical protein
MNLSTCPICGLATVAKQSKFYCHECRASYVRTKVAYILLSFLDRPLITFIEIPRQEGA